MTRASRMQVATRRRSGGGFLTGVVLGVVLGLGVALGVAFYLNKGPLPFRTGSTNGPEKDLSSASAKPIEGLPLGGAAPAEPAKPTFDFYKILPGSEEPVTEKQAKADLGAAAKSQPQAGAPKDAYFIQVGSFQDPAQADNQKAKLAILGFESSVEPAHLPDKGTWYRVRMGPYTKIEDINRVRQQLAQNGVEASLVKVKEQ